MKRKIALFLYLVAGVVWMMAQSAQAAQSAVNLSTPGRAFDSAGFTLGFEFQVTEKVQVSALGVYDSDRDGLASNAQVALWNDADGALLASAIVPSGTSAALDGYFRQVAIRPVTLDPGILYVVGAFLPVGMATSLGNGEGSVGSFSSLLTAVVDRSWDQGFDFPLGSDLFPGAWLGANFRVAAVPEPQVWSCLLMGLCVMIGWTRRRTAARSLNIVA